MITSTPIVGAYHRPPAKTILALLPEGAPLLLVPEPDNMYDVHAVKVCVDLRDMDDDFWNELAPHMDGAGVERDEVKVEDFHLGYVDSKKTGNAKAVKEAFDAGYICDVAYSRDMAGSPIALIVWE